MKKVILGIVFVNIFLVSYVSFADAKTDTERAKEFAKEAITEIFFKRNPAAIDKYVVEDYIQHQPGIPNGRQPFKNYLTMMFKAFPDYQGEIESIVAEGEFVSFHFKWTGTHQGEFMGIKPTGKRISRRTADVLRIKNNRIVEHWGIVDQVDMMKELGLLKSVK